MLAEWALGISLTTALFVAWVSYKTYRRSLRHIPSDLYDRQKSILDAVMTFLAETGQRGNTDSIKLVELLRATKDAELYFPGNEIKDYVRELYEKGLKLEYTNKMLDASNLPVGDRRTQLAQQACDISEYLAKQFSVARALFGKHLKVNEL